MRKLSVLALVLASSACGDSDALQQCRDSVAASCAKLFECYTTDADRAALMLTSSAECVTEGQKRCELRMLADGGTTTQPCDTGKFYDSSAAAQCIKETKALKCDALRSGQLPSSCGNTCK